MLSESKNGLPDDLLISTLTFLSLKDLARFKCLSHHALILSTSCEKRRIPKISNTLYFFRDIPLKRTLSIYEDALISTKPTELLNNINDEGLLAHAVAGNLLHVVDKFLSIRADVNASNPHNYTALTIAVILGNTAITKRLLKEDKLKDRPAFKNLKTLSYARAENREIIELLKKDRLQRFNAK